MPPQPWATKEENEFLEEQLTKYRQLQATKQYTHFWARLFEDWFKQWPEVSKLFPDKAGETLTTEENDQLGNAQKARRRVRHTWMIIYEVNLIYPTAASNLVPLSIVSNSKQMGSDDIQKDYYCGSTDTPSFKRRSVLFPLL